MSKISKYSKFSSNTQKLFEFLDDHTTDNVELFTHTSMGFPYGKFKLSLSDQKIFFKLYTEAIKDGTELYITEKHLKYGPIIIDLDIKYEVDADHITSENNGAVRYYDNADILEIIKIYNEIINKYLDIEDYQYTSYVFEKINPTVLPDGKNKDGVHIMYPNICCTCDLQYIIRDEVMQIVKKNKILDKIQPINTIEDIFDEAVISKNGWLLYGSKKPNSMRYKLTKIYDDQLQIIEDATIFDELVEFFSIRKFNHNDIDKLNDEFTTDDIKNKFEQFGLSKMKEPVVRQCIKTANPEDVRRARIIVNLLDNSRAEDFQKWIQLGFCLHNIDYSLLDTWINFSQRSKKFKDPSDCEKRWCHFKNEGLTIGSLYKWAKEDNPKGFSDYKITELGTFLERGLSGTAYDIAVLIHEFYKYDFVCASIEHNDWYEFKEHRWMPVSKGYTLVNKINEEMVNEYTLLSSKYAQAASTENLNKDYLLGQQKQATMISLKLRTKFKKDIMEECKNIFYNPKFYENIDENKFLLGFLNGVYDLEKNEFRDGRPEDMITMTTNINYIPYDPNNEYIQKLLKIVREIQPELDMSNYILDLLCSFLQGHNPDEKIHIWTGKGGSNGKSLILNLFLLAMGDYGSALPVTVLTGKRGASNAASPELSRMKGKRFGMLQEPEGEDKVYIGKMKELTAGDKIQARALFKDPIEFIPQFKCIMACNKLPYIPGTDGGTWRRIRAVPFEIKFCDNPDPNNPNEKQIDKELKQKYDSLKEPMMSLLIHRFAYYKKNGYLKEPEKVVICTNEYKKNSNVIIEFMSDNVNITEKNTDFISLTDLYREFKTWLKQNHTEIKQAQPCHEFKEELISRFGRMNNNGWIKMCFKEMQSSNAFIDDEPQENLHRGDSSTKTQEKNKNSLDRNVNK